MKYCSLVAGMKVGDRATGDVVPEIKLACTAKVELHPAWTYQVLLAAVRLY